MGTQILSWLQSNPNNDEKKIKRAKENRRRQVNIEEARRIAKRDKEKKQRKENKQPKEQHPKNKLTAHNFTTTPRKLTNKPKIERALAAIKKKKLANDSRKKERKKERKKKDSSTTYNKHLQKERIKFQVSIKNHNHNRIV